MTLSLDLFLLGFTVTSGICAGQPLFDRPNSKLLEEILYFLLVTTKGEEGKERLRNCWPVVNAIQAKQFRTEALKLYEELRKNGEISREIILRKSMLDEGAGERLEEGLAKWAEFLIVKYAGDEADSEPAPTMTGAAYACEMLIRDSPLNQLHRIREQIAHALSQFQNISIPVITPRPFSM